MKATPIIAAFLLCFAGISQACCPPFWSQFKGARCYRYVGTPSTWFEAREYCYHLSPGKSHLLTLNSDSEANHIHTIFMENGAEKHTSYWIGLHDFNYNQRVFEWDDGSLSGYSFWNTREPNNNGVEDCVEVYRTNRRWNDHPCTALRRPFFCEMDR